MRREQRQGGAVTQENPSNFRSMAVTEILRGGIEAGVLGQLCWSQEGSRVAGHDGRGRMCENGTSRGA